MPANEHICVSKHIPDTTHHKSCACINFTTWRMHMSPQLSRILAAATADLTPHSCPSRKPSFGSRCITDSRTCRTAGLLWSIVRMSSGLSKSDCIIGVFIIAASCSGLPKPPAPRPPNPAPSAPGPYQSPARLFVISLLASKLQFPPHGTKGQTNPSNQALLEFQLQRGIHVAQFANAGNLKSLELKGLTIPERSPRGEG